jgi:glycosyltransferase involved in cell wall biosynthesis
VKRVLFVARNRYRVPLSPSLALKWDALARVFELRVLASSPDSATGDETFRLRARSSLDGPRFWLTLPARIKREARAFRPDAIVAQSPFEAAAALVARTGVPVIVELHGDWRTFGRLYGSGARLAIAQIADGVGTWAVKRAAKVRAVSPYTERLAHEVGREPAGVFPAFMDLAPFASEPVPLPEQTVALFIGVLEPYKNIDGLAEAWRRARPAAELRIVGKGTRTDVVASLVRDGLATWQPELSTDEVVRALDDASALILPSRSEGMGRVVIEAQLRGRPVLGANVGGIPDLVTDGLDG